MQKRSVVTKLGHCLTWMYLSGLPLLVAMCGCTGHERPAPALPPPAQWTTGFWFWNGSSASVVASNGPLDVLFCQAGTIRNRALRVNDVPWERLPPAREYWLVYRADDPRIPEARLIPSLVENVAATVEEGKDRKLQVAGIQLDIDSPTSSLPEYAAFLKELRTQLPPGTKISITALLDWFQPLTEVAQVVNEVDEFVPQFYDVQDREEDRAGAAIAMRFEAAKWGARFQQFRKRFRIGVSTFGRSRFLPSPEPPGARYPRSVWLQDLKPLDVAVDPAFRLDASRTAAGELMLRYRAQRKAKIGYTSVETGDSLEFVVATRESIRDAVEQAKRMGSYCAGVVFFRWPAFNETLAMPPDEVLAAAGASGGATSLSAELRVVDGGCAAVSCTDLYLLHGSPLVETPIRYRIHSSAELEYFLPKEKMPVKMSGAAELELILPPYGGRGRLHLGRAVTAKRSEFTMEQVR